MKSRLWTAVLRTRDTETVCDVLEAAHLELVDARSQHPRIFRGATCRQSGTISTVVQVRSNLLNPPVALVPDSSAFLEPDVGPRRWNLASSSAQDR